MTDIIVGVICLGAALVFWRRPGVFEWLDDQTNIRGVSMFKRFGYRNDRGQEFHARRRRALRSILITFLPILGVAFVLNGLAQNGS